jgi:hypothetical protein
MLSMKQSVALATVVLGLGSPYRVSGDGPAPASRARLARLPLGSVTAQGWLKTQLQRNKAGMGGHLDELEPEMIGKPFVDRNHCSPVCPGWSGEISGTYWTGLVQLAFALDDGQLKSKARKWVTATLALQEEDGYLGSYRKTENRLEDYSAWSANWCYRALLHWYDATGDEAVLRAVHRGLLWFVKHWDGDNKTSYAGPVLMESMIAVYLKTGDVRLYHWCLDYLRWLDRHDQFHHGMASLQRVALEYNEDHVVAFGENAKHPALIYAAGGPPEYLAASRHGIEQVMAKCWQCTGAPASNFEYLSPPSAVHGTEYCNCSTYLNTFSWMAAITGDACYGDFMERILFNAAQAARKKDERAIAYMSSPNQVQATMDSCLFSNDNSFEVYAPAVHVACCPVQSVRIYPEYVRGLCMRDEAENLFLPAYGPCAAQFVSAAGPRVTIREETAYPFDETVTLRIRASTPWRRTLMLKIPAWCKAYCVKLNGLEVRGPVAASGYLPVEHTWHDDQVTIRFEMTPKVVAVDDVYFAKEPLRAVECGPLVFALRLPEHWTAIKGTPLTALPKEWSWYEVSSVAKDKPAPPPFYALSLDELARKPIVKRRCESAYPWDDSPLKLAVPMHRSTHAYPPFRDAQKHTLLGYGNPVTADAASELVELVPIGCTTLRLTCFPVCK